MTQDLGGAPPHDESGASTVAAPQEAEQAKRHYAIGQGATAVTVVGGVMLVIASFLPLDEPTGTFSQVRTNTIVQNGEWLIPVIGAAIILAAFNSYLTNQRRRSLIVLSVVVGIAVAVLASDKSTTTLYPVGPNGQLNQSEPQKAALGIAIYLAAAGTALALGGSIAMARSQTVTAGTPAEQPVEARPTKVCPDCAETILAEARVCKHCGYRFG